MKRFALLMMAMCLAGNAIAAPAPKAAKTPKAAKPSCCGTCVASKATLAKMQAAVVKHAGKVITKQAPAPKTKGCPTIEELAAAGLVDAATVAQWDLCYKAGKLCCVTKVVGAAATPQATLKNLVAGIKAGNGKVIGACFAGTAESKATLVSQMEMFPLMSEFATKMKKAYGENALGGGMKIPDMGALLSKMADAKITIDGDTATAKMDTKDLPQGLPAGAGNMTLNKVKGAWVIKNPMAGQTVPPQAMEMQKVIMGALKKTIKDLLPQIGKEGVTAKDIQMKLQMAMMKALQSAMPQGGMPGGPMPEENPGGGAEF